MRQQEKGTMQTTQLHLQAIAFFIRATQQM